LRIFKAKTLTRFTKRERIDDASLARAIAEAERGLIDADLGGHVIKKRVPRAGQGKSGGYRMLIALRTRHRAVFLFGFAKNELDNIDDKQLITLQEAAAYWLAVDDKRLEQALKDGNLIEVRQ
jgi:hypothetical protein